MATYFILYIYALWRTTFILEVIDIANPLARSQQLIFFICAKNDRDLIVLVISSQNFQGAEWVLSFQQIKLSRVTLRLRKLYVAFYVFPYVFGQYVQWLLRTQNFTDKKKWAYTLYIIY
jgi:hypothetical protein